MPWSAEARPAAQMRGTSRGGAGSGALIQFFFFQAEDGIRDVAVTGVQTCALPIFRGVVRARPADRPRRPGGHAHRLRQRAGRPERGGGRASAGEGARRRRARSRVDRKSGGEGKGGDLGGRRVIKKKKSASRMDGAE